MEFGQVKHPTEKLINEAVGRQKLWMSKMRARGKALFKYLSKHTVKTAQTLVAVTPVVNKFQNNEVSRQSYGKKWKYLLSVLSVLAIIVLIAWLIFGYGCTKKSDTSVLQTEVITLTEEPLDTSVPATADIPEPMVNAPAEPTFTGTEYTVQQGDCLWTIANNLLGSGYEYTTLAEYNNISNPDLIFPGQVIKIPTR